jgi:hypothetical protein
MSPINIDGLDCRTWALIPLALDPFSRVELLSFLVNHPRENLKLLHVLSNYHSPNSKLL